MDAVPARAASIRFPGTWTGSGPCPGRLGTDGGGFDRLDAEMDRLPGVDGGDAVEMLAMHEALDCLASNKPVA